MVEEVLTHPANIIPFFFLLVPWNAWHLRTSQVREHELKQLLATAEQLKDRWKSEMVTLTDGLQRKLAALRRENCMLKAENNQLKDQLLRVADPAVAEHQNRDRDLQQ